MSDVVEQVGVAHLPGAEAEVPWWLSRNRCGESCTKGRPLTGRVARERARQPGVRDIDAAASDLHRLCLNVAFSASIWVFKKVPDIPEISKVVRCLGLGEPILDRVRELG